MAQDTSWRLVELREHIRGLGPDSDQVLKTLESVACYVDMFRYHLSLARDAMNGVVIDNDPHGIENMKLIFGFSDQQEQFARAKLVSQANILGCLNSARFLLDVFAFLVNGVLLGSKIPADACNVHAVTAALSSCRLKIALQELLASYWFRYVNAFVNTCKHRYLMPHGFWVSFETTEAGIRVEGFDYKGESYPAYGVQDLLEGVLTVKNAVVFCGRMLNDRVLGGVA